jgi:nicotinamide mononucleotide transporter
MNWRDAVSYLVHHWLEAAGFVATVWGIWLAARRKMLTWPITQAANVLYLIVFFEARLYSDTLLQFAFIAFTFYGWWNWARGARATGEIRIEPLSALGFALPLAVGFAGSVLLGWCMVRIGAALPWLDAALASFSLVASWWQARKNIVNWLLWIVVDAAYIGEYIYKGLLLTALLYAILIALCLQGIRDWRRAPHSSEK